MSDTLGSIQDLTKDNMHKALLHLDSELMRIRAGKATPSMLEGIMVSYYGTPTPLNQVCNVTAPDARTLNLQPWEKSIIGEIEKAILQANIGITPQNDGENIRLFLPPLTEERRRELVKKMNAEIEQAKIAVRNIRRDSIEKLKKLKNDGLSEDEVKNGENSIQGLTDDTISKIDKMASEKEADIMKV